ncbi:MAG: hypothetical protein ABR555_14935, partial [Pyrinomonadaceae bacterium]
MSVEDPRHPREREKNETTESSIKRRWRYFTRRHAILASTIVMIGILAVILLGLILYRLGFVDRYVAGQIKDTFANYGIRAEITTFHASFPPQTVEMNGIELYDSQTGEKLGKIDRLLATIRVEDLYALNLRRNINLKDLKIEGLEAWVSFDEQGRSNFRNIHIPPPEPNKRILFAYSTANVEIKNGVVHYGDVRHEISGEARNLLATIQPDDPNAPAESRMNAVSLSVTNSTFTYDGRPIENIDVQAHGRVNQTRAEMQEVVLKSPVAEIHLQGTMDDWRALRYQMNVTSSVDLTQVSNTLQTSTVLRGVGSFSGTVNGEGDKFKVEGTIKSDALAADGIRLNALSVTGSGNGQGKTYEINGRAVAALLTAGDFQIDALQFAGNIMGTGTDFRWIGELRAVAEHSYGTTIAGLILHDARAEMNHGVLTASSSQFSASGLSGAGAKASGITASDLRLRNENNVTTATVSSVKTGNVIASNAQIKGVTANNIDIVDRNGVTSVNVKNVEIVGASAAGAEIGSLNIAGVRLSVRNRRIEGSTADINAGTVKLAEGQAENVRLAKPVFIVEPSGSYRASSDLSIGGGVLGRMNMGQAHAQLVATSREIQLNNFTADVFKGTARGSARIGIVDGVPSNIAADFSALDIGGPLTALSGTAVPLTGRATGRVELTFSGTNFKLASGTITTHLSPETGETSADRIPITGTVALQADHGLFNIQTVNLQTPATSLTATGQFSFENNSNLNVNVSSTNAAELQTVLISSGLLPDVEEQMSRYGIGLGGQFAFNGTLRGSMSSPDIDGRVSLGTLIVNGHDLGALSAGLVMTAQDLRVTDGRLTERDGGGVQFSLTAPRTGENNTSLEAILDRASAGTLLAVLPMSRSDANLVSDTQADVSGQIKVTGIPNAMSGSADLRFGPGRLAGEPLESLVARATFNGSNVNIESVDAQLGAGHIVASGNYNTTSKAFDVQGRAEGIQLSRIAMLTGRPELASITGVGNFNGRISGNLSESDFSGYQINFDGSARNVTIQGRAAGDLTLIGRTENRQLSITLTSGVLGQPQVLSAQVNLASERLTTTIETTLNNADLTNLFRIAFPQTAVDISGRATGSFKAAGSLLDEDGYFSLAGLSGTATFTDLTFRVQDIQLNAATPLTVRFTPNEITFDATHFTGPGTNIVLDGTVATAAGGHPSLNITGSLNMRVLTGVSPDFFALGSAEVAVRLNGTYEAPRVIGTASMSGASISLLIGNDRWTIANLNALLRFTANQAQIDSFAGTLGGGRVTATGGALLEGLTISRFLVNLHGDD